MTRLARALNSSDRLAAMRELEAAGVDRKKIARDFGVSAPRVTQLLGRKYIKASRQTKACWSDMMRRCYNQEARNFCNWGGRGIAVCERWHEFKNFLADMGEAPAGLTIDRIDNNGNYDPGNCRWATYKQQLRNRRNNRLITAGGVTKTLAEWAESLGVSEMCIWHRLRVGWDPEAAVTQPSSRS
jgi:hypothetical protein